MSIAQPETKKRPKLSFKNQAKFLEYLIERCQMANSAEIATETWLKLEERDVLELERLAAQLNKMSLHEKKIKSVSDMKF